jgi:hypothetical protein
MPGAQGFASSEVKTGVVPGTAHRLINDKPVEERPVVVGAVSPDCKNVGPLAHNEHLLVPDVADQLAPVGELSEGNSLRQIGPDQFSRVSQPRPLSAPAPRGGDPSPRPRSRRALCRPAAAVCRPPGTLLTSHIHRRGDALAATEFGNALLAAQPFQHDANLLLGRKVSTRRASDVLDCFFRRLFFRPGFLSHLRSLRLR